MAWESRGKQHYFYRARRVNGKLVKEYVGKGLEAELAARALSAKRERREKERAEIRELEESLAPVLTLMQELESGVRLLVHGSFLAAGFHQHKGSWRKRRVRKSDNAKNKPANDK